MDYEQNSAGRNFLTSESFCRVIGIEREGADTITLCNFFYIPGMQQEIDGLFCLAQA